jgi:hypothetical protein
MTPYPRYVQDWTPEHRETAIQLYMTESLTRLRKRQLINRSFTEHAHRRGDTDGLKSCQAMADLLAAAIDRKEFPEHQTNPLGPSPVQGGRRTRTI